MQIMYVCTGNQCRSVMAEYYTRAKLADRGIGLQSGNITVRSAGTLHYPPHPADPMVIDLLKNDGIDANSHSSTPLTTDISRQADLILCFEREQISDLLEQNPLAIRKVFLYARRCGLNAISANRASKKTVSYCDVEIAYFYIQYG